MEFKGEITVAAPRADVYARIRDAEFFVSCIEGVRDLEVVDDTHYTAVMESKVAYIKVSFDVSVEVLRDEAPNLIEAKIEGRPIKLAGRLAATSLTRLAEADGGTKISYETELSLTGKLGSLGRPALTAKAKEMEKLFADRLAAAFSEGGK
ncbi:MAG: SRPBCC domain-containing protein [Pseudomonadota bacterium]|nr:SRPBCC domain-containing protein [Pseudomonadota bacterium]MEC7536777.1 SRPBCC domain-containing protein [Pseudomonadota bacterium]